MSFRLILACLVFLSGCPKKDLPSLEEIERQEQLKELLEEEDLLEDLPEPNDNE
jgi:hypothetical protein